MVGGPGGGGYAYTWATRRLMSTSRSMWMSPNVCFLNLCFRNVRRHPATGQGAGPCEKMRSTHDSHILW